MTKSTTTLDMTDVERAIADLEQADAAYRAACAKVASLPTGGLRGTPPELRIARGERAGARLDLARAERAVDAACTGADVAWSDVVPPHLVPAWARRASA